MEKSVKNYSSRERIVPALLLVIGLICASWISAQTSKSEKWVNSPDKFQAQSDTIKKDKKIKKGKEASSKKDATATSDNKSDNRGTKGEGESDDDADFYAGPHPFPDIHIPPIPDIDLMMPPFPEVPLHLDASEFGLQGNDWAEFSKEFEENFKSKFGDFYEKHQEEIRRMLEDVHEKVNNKFAKEWELKMGDFAEEQGEWAKAFADKWEREAKLMSHQEANMKDMHEAQQKEFERNHQEFEKNMKAFEERNRLFEEKMKEQLIKDGYLGKDEKLETMHWHNGKIEINGKKIKAEDEKKYHEIHDKYFNQLRKFE